MIKIYKDGSWKPTNPGPCGAGVIVIIDNEIKECRSVYLGIGTNNIAELMAIEIALDILINNNLLWESSIIITDSKYSIGVILGTYKAYKNIDLISRIKTKLDVLPNLEIQWIKGHSGDRFNTIVDDIAKQAINLNLNI